MSVQNVTAIHSVAVETFQSGSKWSDTATPTAMLLAWLKTLLHLAVNSFHSWNLTFIWINPMNPQLLTLQWAFYFIPVPLLNCLFDSAAKQEFKKRSPHFLIERDWYQILIFPWKILYLISQTICQKAKSRKAFILSQFYSHWNYW